MRAARILGMQPSRAFQMQATKMLRLQASPAQMLRQTRPVRAPVPEEHSAHTITQRLRTLKKIPVELLPLALVMAVALGAAAFSLVHKLLTDKTLRLTRQGNKHKAPPKEGGH